MFGEVPFLREDTRMACHYASVNLDFCSNVARCLNQSRASAVLKSKLIAAKFGTAEARLMLFFFFKHEHHDGSIKPHLAKMTTPSKFYLF